MAYSVGYPEELTQALRLKVGQGLVGAAVAEGRPILVNDVRLTRGTSRRCRARTPSSSSRCGERGGSSARSTCSATRGPVHRDRRGDAAPVRRAVSVGDRERPPVRARARVRLHARDARRDRRARSAPILDLDELLTRIAQLAKPRHRLPHLRHPAHQRGDQRARDEARREVRRQGDRAARQARARGWWDTRRCTRSRCSSPTCSADPRYIKVVDDVRSELVIPLLVKDRCIGVFDLESPELDAFTQEPRRDAHAAREPGGRGHRECAALRDDPRQRGPAREGNPVRPARSGRAAAGRTAQAAEGRRRRARASRRRASWVATCTTSSRRNRTPWWSPSATCRARAWPPRSTAHLPAS